MCGKTIHMVEVLKPVLQNRMKFKVKKLPLLKNNDTYKAFLFVKKNCGYSEAANKLLQNNLKIDAKDICLVEPMRSRFVCAEKLYKNGEWVMLDKDTKNLGTELNSQLQSVLGIWQVDFKNTTFPQVFLHAHPKWHYIGGCDDLREIISSSSTVGDTRTQESDLLHLLPLVKEGTGTQPTQLKF